ncbi:hypothetical protein AAC387_Pa03g2416 [Persea americana]
MDQETVKFDLDELLESDCFTCSAIKDKENNFHRKQDGFLLDLESRVDLIMLEKCLAQYVRNNDSAQLISLSHKIRKKVSEKANVEGNEASSLEESVFQSIASRLLHLACKLDCVDCAAALLNGDCTLMANISDLDENGRTPLHNAAREHSTRCIELLLQKAARTDFRSNDNDSLIPLEVALSSKRLQVDWTPNQTVERLLYLLSERDLSAVRLLMVKTKELPKVLYTIAMEGKVAALAVLLMVDADRVNAPMVLPRGTTLRSRVVETTVYDCVVREAMALGRIEVGQVGLNSCRANPDSSVNRSGERKAMLCAMELLQFFGAVSQGSCTDKRMVSPLISACEAGDEAVVELLLKTKIDVNETDGDGSSALHSCLRASPYSNDLRFRLAWLLLRHGARVSQKNKLGLTPVHVAAGNGNFQALQILLLCDPNCVNVASETEETPLFFAVKSNSMECVELLLSFGANTQSLNLRKERPIDLTKSQDMRFILSPTNLSFWNRVIPIQETGFHCLNHDRSDADVCEGVLDPKQISFERISTSPKTDLCRYYGSPSGCARGAKCFFTHGEAELRKTKSGSVELKKGLPSPPISRNLSKHTTHVSDDLSKKIFIGGLSPSVDSADLKDYFEEEFGAVEDAVVIGSQAGDYMQSRGFGFVTFKSEESVNAAVQAHYVNISGKKVEIKGAIPKDVLHEFQKASRQHKHEHQQLLNPFAKEAKDEGRQEPMSWAERLIASGPRTTSPDIRLGHTTRNTPLWLETFKRWLPSFLIDVSKRLGEGECYPLSSLKGDFRATCGLELDHTSLGYLKLSDFMRSFSGICRMKIVPVGNGPATHMILLPSPPQSNKQPHAETQTPAEESKHQPLYDDLSEPFTNPWGRYQVNNENEVGFLAKLISLSFSNLECDGLANAGGLGHQGDPEAFSSFSVDPKFLSFLQPGYSFLRPWNTPPEQADGLEQRGPQKSYADDKRVPFSFFTHQFDYWKNFGANNICVLCTKRKALWAVMPCKHKLLCTICKSTQRLMTHCFCCHLPVESFFQAPWGDTISDFATHNSEPSLGFPNLRRQDSSGAEIARNWSSGISRQKTVHTSS